jgi:hypothetical protein
VAISKPFNSQGGTIQEISGEVMKQEDLSDQCDGSRTTFTVSEAFDSDSLRVYWNGVRQQIGETITVASSTTFTTSFTPSADHYLFIDYSRS